MGKKLVITIICTLLVICSMGALPAMAGVKEGPDHYTALTADGITLAMKRYRPDATARFRKGAQPIILMEGFCSNMNEFDVLTPPGENYVVKLPSPLATWARGDKYIQKDHMRYYSLAYYLWLQGYDVWMANFRGEGRTPYKSGGETGYSLDDLGIHDVPAVVEKVYKITGKHPVWLGHSTGSTMAYIYLQGAKYGPGSNPHVVSDPALARERNGGRGPQSIKALVDLDGPMVVCDSKVLNNSLVWYALSLPWFVELRGLLKQFGSNIAEPSVFFSNMLWYIYKALGLPDYGPLNMLLSINGQNEDPAIVNFGTKYCFDGFSTRASAQFFDAAVYGTFREDYANGHKDLVDPPAPQPGDGYYYYSDHLKKIKIPSIVLADSRKDLTNPQDIKNFYLGKTRNPSDMFVQMRTAAHCDIAIGYTGPSFLYPTVGKWLKKLFKKH